MTEQSETPRLDPKPWVSRDTQVRFSSPSYDARFPRTFLPRLGYSQNGEDYRS